MSQKLTNKKLAFTLIEMSVVLLIIGILAGIVLRNIGSQGVVARDTKRTSDLTILGTMLVQYSNAMGQFPTTNASATNNGWTNNFVNAFRQANLSTQLPLPPSGASSDIYEYFPCSLGANNPMSHFILRAKLEQTASAAPNIYKNSYNSSSPPAGWLCVPSSIDCSQSNNYFCYTQ